MVFCHGDYSNVICHSGMQWVPFGCTTEHLPPHMQTAIGCQIKTDILPIWFTVVHFLNDLQNISTSPAVNVSRDLANKLMHKYDQMVQSCPSHTVLHLSHVFCQSYLIVLCCLYCLCSTLKALLTRYNNHGLWSNFKRYLATCWQIRTIRHGFMN